MMRTLRVFAAMAALLALQAGTAAAQQPKVPPGINPKNCSYNACIRACIQTRPPNCDQACQVCTAK